MTWSKVIVLDVEVDDLDRDADPDLGLLEIPHNQHILSMHFFLEPRV